jgi:transposase-like protein
MKRHPRAFWVGLVGELERGATAESVARRHGVHPVTLRWWRTMLRREAASGAQRLVPVVVSTEPARVVSQGGHIDIAIRGLVLRVATGTDIAYAAELVRALEPC